MMQVKSIAQAFSLFLYIYPNTYISHLGDSHVYPARTAAFWVLVSFAIPN